MVGMENNVLSVYTYILWLDIDVSEIVVFGFFFERLPAFYNKNSQVIEPYHYKQILI